MKINKKVINKWENDIRDNEWAWYVMWKIRISVEINHLHYLEMELIMLKLRWSEASHKPIGQKNGIKFLDLTKREIVSIFHSLMHEMRKKTQV